MAFVVAVFGDSIAYDLARGLSEAYGSDPQTGVFDATDADLGLARRQPQAWPAAIDDVVKKAGRTDAAVVLLGSSDLAEFVDDRGTRLAFGSPAWREAYGARVDAAVAAFRTRNIPLIWVGLPVARDPDTASGFADLNAIVREHADKAGATYIDSWEAFTDESGQYDATGPDVTGQTVKLRRNDGLHFTRAGSRKLASFIEPDLKRQQDRAQSSRQLAALAVDDRTLFDQALEVDINAQIRREAGLPAPSVASPERRKEAPVVELTAAPVASDGRLATLAVPLKLSRSDEATLDGGLAPPPQRGRTDDFTWPRP